MRPTIESLQRALKKRFLCISGEGERRTRRGEPEDEADPEGHQIQGQRSGDDEVVKTLVESKKVREFLSHLAAVSRGYKPGEAIGMPRPVAITRQRLSPPLRSALSAWHS